MRCSPNAERKYFVRPVKRISGGSRLLERDRVADEVRPQPAHDVSTTAYCTPTSTFASVCRVGRSFAQFLDRDELEEDVVVGHDAEQVVARVFGRDEPLRAGVHLAELHRVAADLLLNSSRYGSNFVPPWMTSRRSGQTSAIVFLPVTSFSLSNST